MKGIIRLLTKHAPDELIIYGKPSVDGWTASDLSLPEVVQSSRFGRDEGSGFREFLSMCLRGSVSCHRSNYSGKRLARQWVFPSTLHFREQVGRNLHSRARKLVHFVKSDVRLSPGRRLMCT